MTNVIYVAGYGRSGTTILDMMLSSNPSIASGGEVFRAAEIFADEQAICSCGQPIISCPVWSNVRVAYESAANAFGGLQAMQKAFMAFEGQRGRDDKKIKAVWEELNILALRALMDGKPGAQFVVDSSKTARGAARRPRLLAQIDDVNVTLLPVQRRAGSVIASARKGTNRDMENGVAQSDSLLRGLRAYAGWIMADAATRHATASLPSLPMMHHEDLVTDAEGAFERILAGLNLILAPDWRDRLAKDTRHLIGGNRTRFGAPKIKQVEGSVAHSDLMTRVGRGMGFVLSRGGVL
jgi:hypothetical protein